MSSVLGKVDEGKDDEYSFKYNLKFEAKINKYSHHLNKQRN